jgi:hypothetical protein
LSERSESAPTRRRNDVTGAAMRRRANRAPIV